MKAVGLILLIQLVFLTSAHPQTAEKFAAIWEKEHISKIFPSDVRHKDLQNYLEQLKKSGLKVDEVGRSYAGREIYQAEFGKGPTKVFLWSQMHGDEPTATSALIDMFAFLQKNRRLDWVRKIEQMLTIRAVPMLNPDGAEFYQRRNIQGVDINRDALALETPEARLLKKLRDDWSPEIGFNLHNQGALTTVGRSDKQAAISLLVVYGDAAKTTNPGQNRNRRLASAIVLALQRFIPGNISRYDDEFTATAFGDNFSAWGTPVILIETGALYGKDEMFLTKMNFVALLTALAVLADGSERSISTAPYDSLINNGSGILFSFIFRGATIIDPAAPRNIYSADLAANIDRRRASFPVPSIIRAIGDLRGSVGLEEYNASNFWVVQRFRTFRVGEMAEFSFYRKDRPVDWTASDLEKQFPPDAIFSTGKWIKGNGIVPRK